MRIHLNSRRVLFKDLRGDQYGLKALPQDSVKGFLDIGANSGFVSIMARFLHPEMEIAAAEPHSRTYRDMLDNVANLKIKPMNIALGDGSDFYLYKERKMDLCNHFTPTPGIAGVEARVRSARLDKLVELSRLDPGNLAIKMDVEGAEKYVVGHEPSERIIIGTKMFSGELHADEEHTVEGYFEWLLKLLQGSHTLTMTRMAKGLGVFRAMRKGW